MKMFSTPPFAVLLVLVAPLACHVGHSRAGQPNIVLLYADDMGYGDLGVQNPDSKIPTPHLDRLAAEGVRFTDAHSSSGICTPSRYAMLYGRFHWRKFHGIVTSFGATVMDSDRESLPQVLRSRGYRTACIGKWHLGWDWEAIRDPSVAKQGKSYPPEAFDWSQSIPGGPLAFGFDSYFGDDVPNFPPYAWIENDRVTEPPTVPYARNPRPTEGAAEGRPGPMVAGWRQDAVMPTLTTRAVEWIRSRRGDERPFFLYFPFTSPHAPIVPTADWQGKTEAGGYGDFMAQTDDTVGQVLHALEQTGLADETIVVFTSDNGPEVYAYERVRQRDHRSTGALRGLKRDIWEGGHRVPMLVRWPGVIEPGRVSDALISQVDLFATLAAAVGAEVPERTADDSHNQLPLWRDNAPSRRDTLVHNTNKNGYALRHCDWLLVDAPTGGVSRVPAWYDKAEGYEQNTQPGELYDLRSDPSQRNNLFAEMPDKVAELRGLLAEVRRRGQVRNR